LKTFLFFTFFISTQVFAIDFNKVTGSFDIESQNSKQEDLTKLAYGSFESKTEQGRVPASENKVENKVTSEVNEVSGSFE
jgi:hypothetical protein